MKIFLATLLLISAFGCSNIFAQSYFLDKEKSDMSIGLLFGVNYANYESDFTKFEPLVKSGYTDGKNMKAEKAYQGAIGGYIECKISKNISIEARAVVQLISLNMSYTSDMSFVDGSGVSRTISNKKMFMPNIGAIIFSPVINFYPDESSGFRFSLTPEIGVIYSKTYQLDLGIMTEGVYFENCRCKVATLNPKGTKIPNMNNVYLNFSPEFGYKIKLSSELYIYPSIGYSLGLTNLANDVDWKYNALKFNLKVGRDL